SQNVLIVATATFPGILLIFLVSFKNHSFRHEKGFETISMSDAGVRRGELRPANARLNSILPLIYEN
ncbi:MAG: hypothetical protein WC621_00945, partial [Patescibacteria group bacterium]